MKKNWKEILKLWLGALLLLAESAAIGCKKLPKKAVALCVAAALVVAMVPVAVGAAETTNYDIWVEGTQVTSENQSNVLGKTGWSGATVTYDPTTNTLTLNYAALKSSNGTYNFGGHYVIYFGANAPANPILMVNGICSIVAESSDNTIIGIGASRVNLTIQKANSSSTLGIQVESTKEYNHGSSAFGIEAGNQLIFDGANVSVVTNGTARLTNGIFVMDYNSPVVTAKNSAYLNLSASGTATNNYALNYNAGGTLTIDDTSTAIFQSDDADCISTGISLNKDSEGNYTQIILADANKDGVMETHTSKPRNPYASRIEVHPAVKVTLDLSSAGGTSQELYWAKGVKFPEPSAPSIKGYVFEGWYTSSNYTTAFNFNQNLNTNKTIYAKLADYEGDKKTLQDAIDALEADVAQLNSLMNSGDIAQINAKISAIESQIAALDALKNKYAEADAALKQQLQEADAAINAAIAALTVRVQDLEADLAAAKSDISTNTSKVAELTTNLATLNASLTDLSNKLTNDYATKAELTSAINSAKDTINSAIDALTTRVQDLEAGLAAVNSKVDTNTSDVTALKSDVAALNTWKAQSQSTIAALETLTATQSADIARLKTAVQDLEAALAAAEARIDDAEDRIAALEGKVSALEIAKQNLDAAVAALNAAINNKADTATLNQKVTDLIAAIAAAEDAAKTYADGKDIALQTRLTAAIATAKGEAITAAENLVNTAKAELQTAINNKADIATLNAKVSELNAAIATAEATAKAYTDSAVTTLNAAIITAKDEAVDTAKDLVDAAKAQLQAAIDNKADTTAVNAAIANLQNAITALQNAKDNYIAADAALKAELEEKIAKAKQEAIDAAKGHIPYIGTNGNWWIGDTDTGVDANGIAGNKGDKGDTGAAGVGVAKVEKTAANGNVDTYTITLTNGKTYTFTVTNGKDGENGKDGLTPFIGENGNWWIGDTDTGVKAVAEQTAQKGTDTITVVSIVVASVALLSNLALVVWIATKKKKVLV